MHTSVHVATTVGVALLLAGCATTTICPAPGAQVVPGTTEVAVSRVDGIKVTAQSNAWEGSSSVTNAVLPVRVTITNDGDVPLRVRYGDFALVRPDGRRYSVLPPFRVEGRLLRPALAQVYTPMTAPRFVHRGFYVAPYLARLYPGMPVWEPGNYFYDPTYYGYYYHDLERAIRPTVEMLGLAMPEGVIEPEGQLSGFLYFQHVDPGVQAVTFRYTLVGVAPEGAPQEKLMLGEVTIPFTVTTHR